MKIAIAGDHGGVALKSALEKHLDLSLIHI